MMLPPYDTWDNTELYSTIMHLMDQTVIDDEHLQPHLDERLAAIYDALSTPGLRDFVGAVDTSVDAYLGLAMSMAERGALLEALLQEHETRFRAAADAPGRTLGSPTFLERESRGRP